MSDHWKMQAEIEYCVPCGYANLAASLVSELFQAAGPSLAISLIPGHSGALKITVDGIVLWDKKEQGRSPHIMEVKDIKAKVANMLNSTAVIQES
ncbi:MAG: Rdx family protein [Dehalococcoidia bacterium]|tara:strand:- start:166 stop:450 length:285 start_codon:yes stop_codon:yes gene_type:complete